jgi:polysaccharide pyruvyl transferase WcaK-like protein
MTKRSGPDAMSESPRIAFYGNFGAGNLGNEATLQAIIERTQRRWPDGRLMCFCTDPEDVRNRHHIVALRAQAETSGAVARRGGLARIFRIAFKRIPLELAHWIKCLGALRGADMLIAAGTGIVCDYTTGPMGYPHDIFKLSTLAALCRVKLAFLSVGVGPINHPLSRLMLKWSLALASHRSYRDEASRQYLEGIGFSAKRDAVCPDAVFGLAAGALASGASSAGQKRIVGLGIKDYGSAAPETRQAYLDTMAEFVAWLQGQGCGVRLLIGDLQYDTEAIELFVGVLKSRGIQTAAPFLIVEPAPTVEELLRQIGGTEAVISARYHNLVLALILSKPVIALSDHGKLNSVVTEFGFGRYLLPLKNLTADALIERFKELETDTERLRPRLKAKLETYRQALDGLYATFLGETAREARGLDGPARSPTAPLTQKE